MGSEMKDHKSGVSRRKVLQGIGIGAVAATVSPNILIAGEGKKDMESKVMGSGKHTYELVKDWGKVPAGVTLGYTHGVAVDSQGRVYVHNQSEHATVVFDGDGNFIKSWGAKFKDGAHGMQLSKESEGEFFYLADIARRSVVKTTLDGEVIWSLEMPDQSGVYESVEKYRPTNVAIAPNGDFYIADGYGSSYVHQYKPNTEYIRTFGGPGSEQGQMKCPHGIAIDTRGAEPLVLVADRSNVRLQYFTLDGKFVREVKENLLHPCHFDQKDGDLLIPDLHGRVTIFDKDDKLVAHLGENPGVNKIEGYPNLPQDQRVPGKFISPHSACWDHDGNIYVVEWVSDGRITKLKRVA